MAEAGAAPPQADAPAENKDAKSGVASILDDKDGNLSKLAQMVLGKNGGDRLFYFPSRDQPYTPEKYGYKFEDVTFKSADGTELHGWFMPAKVGAKKAKATVVFSHGNAGSVAHHLGFVDWLVRANYNVLLYDYRAFGRSKGSITRKGVIEDVQAAFDYIVTRKDVNPDKLVSFSHSLGGAKSVTAIGMKPIKGLRAVIVDGGFASYRDMAREKAGELGANLTTDEFSAIDYVEKLTPVPLLIVHGEKDTMVPISQGEKLFAKAKHPKTFFRVKNGRHTDALGCNHGEYRKKMLAWLDKALAQK
ncbi:alpha/beta hydrolase [Oceaniferula spumae]|uniref:Alpha/beta hydrolase n=1 Tax=Oceaniferula spumae TaxID=2979115 RepID=A0AAT9FI18_9BACT